MSKKLYVCDCKKPSVVTMDYDKAVTNKHGRWDLEPRVNRVCTTCWTHWFGPPDAVKQYTKAEWDAWLEAA